MRTGVVIITNSNHLGLFRISKNWWDKKSCHLMRRRVVCCKWLQIVLQTKSSLLHNLRMSRIWYGMVCPLHCWSSITFVPDLSSLGGKVGISRHSFTPSLPYLTHLSARTEKFWRKRWGQSSQVSQVVVKQSQGRVPGVKMMVVLLAV